MKQLIICILSFAVFACGAFLEDNGKLNEFREMQSVWDDIIKENFFDLEQILNLYDFEESSICPQDLREDLKEITEKVHHLSLSLDGVNTNAKKEMTSLRPFLRSLSEGARTTSNSAYRLFSGYKVYRNLMLECYDSCKPNLQSISTEVNELLGELVDVTHKGMELSKPIDDATIQHTKKNVQKVLIKLELFRSFMSAFFKCTQKAVAVYQKVQEEFISIFGKIRSSL
ncbi:uncharacterized protein LOC116341466 [Contarinia nasturtii]|uniref:uncharacterized protein LOC116341466 n=1 Tax=Contarinia nasturtii TaxID=265458 RepID=UPI0012D3CBB8|nr:uncharacterized protein LOC116341466 [Contarinia nasturtii]